MEYAEKEHAKRVTTVYLEVGVLRDFIPEYLKKYWEYISTDTIADGSKLLIREIEAKARCGKCNTEYDINMEDLYNNKCPKCGYDKGELIKGRELIIYSIEIEN
ncbi:MAG: hydrogenase maturation nickel metallochaperone HypA [Bacilli bacterium]|nr:hydrogenase maturation nickel metallochaperone HypA [Bacilli bacterium]